MRTIYEILENWENEGQYEDWYKIEGMDYDRNMHITAFVGSYDECIHSLIKYYMKPSETENTWFYRCVLMNTSDAKKWLENIDR